jgi:hypothetical protein
LEKFVVIVYFVDPRTFVRVASGRYVSEVKNRARCGSYLVVGSPRLRVPASWKPERLATRGSN